MKLKCLRCGYEWITRKEGDKPKSCPACKSYFWDKERKNKRKAGKSEVIAAKFPPQIEE